MNTSSNKDKKFEREKNKRNTKDLTGQEQQNAQQQQQIESQKDEINEQQAQSEKMKAMREKMLQILEHSSTTTVMTIITIYALFGDDIRVLATGKDGDVYFSIFNILAMVAFTFEIIISCFAKVEYFNSFFFWLDVISTLSLLLDIQWFSELIFENGDSGASSAASLARAGRASRVGTKAGRIVRIVRLIRLVKLYKHATQALISEADLQEDDNNNNDLNNNNHNEENHNNQTPNARGHQLHQNTLEQRSVKKKQKIHDQSPHQTTNNMQPGTTQIKPLNLNEDNIESQKNKLGKLPPLQPGNKNQAQAENDGPSKPVILDKYKNDPLLQPQTEQNTERIEGQGEDNNIARVHPLKDGEEKDPKQVGTDQIPSNIESQNKVRSIEEKEREKGVIPKETKVGQKLSDLTTKRVITLVLSIMFSVPIFSTNTWQDPTQSFDNGLNTIYLFKDNDTLFEKAYNNFIEFHKDIRTPVIYMEWKKSVPNCCIQYPNDENEDDIVNYKDLRNEEVSVWSIYVGSDEEDVIGLSVQDTRTDNNLDAILSIVRTLFVTIVLSTGAMSFSKDVEQLVLEPIEGMVNKVQRIADNPLEAAQMEEQETLLFQQLKEKNDYKQIAKKKEEERMETVILEKLIIKIGALLAVGFGEAGSEIIAKNMREGGAVDPMLPGQKIMAIFGFCDIRNFTDATEVLQTNVMVFVNEIAEITHGCVDEFCGQSNKNIGDAFLLVWKYKDEFLNKENGDVSLKEDKGIKGFSDLPVISFVKIIAHLAVSKKLRKYKENPGLIKRIPGYNNLGVRMGFGLHSGWAIEGAIGSEFKIDASYLSPNVNMASRLEAATKQFGTQLLISGSLYENLTPRLQKELRHIDRVTVKGSIKPMDLYTCDVAYDLLLENKAKTNERGKYDHNPFQNAIQKKKRRVLDRIKRNRLRKSIEDGTYQISKLLKTDHDLVWMRQIFDQSFYDQWEVAFKLYIDGNWPECRNLLEKTKVYLKDQGFIDGPSQVLIDVIDNNKGKAPSDWQGYRSLTEK